MQNPRISAASTADLRNPDRPNLTQIWAKNLGSYFFASPKLSYKEATAITKGQLFEKIVEEKKSTFERLVSLWSLTPLEFRKKTQDWRGQQSGSSSPYDLTATRINSRNRLTVSPCDTIVCAKCASLFWWPQIRAHCALSPVPRGFRGALELLDIKRWLPAVGAGIGG